MCVYNSCMVLWWALLVLGIAFCAATAVGTIAAYGNERVPRSGFWPGFRDRRPPRWSGPAVFVGVFLLSFASNHLASWDSWTGPALVLGCGLVAGIIRISVIWTHNRRRPARTGDPVRDEAEQGSWS
jgi:hypothetical protein